MARKCWQEDSNLEFYEYYKVSGTFIYIYIYIYDLQLCIPLNIIMLDLYIIFLYYALLLNQINDINIYNLSKKYKIYVFEVSLKYFWL